MLPSLSEVCNFGLLCQVVFRLPSYLFVVRDHEQHAAKLNFLTIAGVTYRYTCYM